MIGTRQGFEGIRGLFAQDDTLGLLFPEDRHAMGWSRNLAFAKEFAARFDFTLPAFPIFPIGMMFWARPAVIGKMADCVASMEIPLEPLPNDGTVLHAIERILPNLCEVAGYEWATLCGLGLARS